MRADKGSAKSIGSSLWGICVTTALASALFAVVPPVYASSHTAEKLLEILKEKKIISAEEYESLAAEIDEEKAQDKVERRKARMREAIVDGEREARREAEKTEIKVKFKDGVTWESADKSTSLSFNGRIQMDYRNFSGEDALNANTFDVRRTYLSGKGTYYNDYSFLVQADFAQTTAPQLDEGWFNIDWWNKRAQFRFGQFKMPMSLEELTSDLYIDFQERSFVNAQVPAKERGAMVYGTATPGVYYSLALSTGQGKNANEGNNVIDSTDVIGRVAANLAEIMGNKNAIYHIGASFSDGTIPVAAAPSERTEARGITFFNAAAFSGSDVDRKRSEFETALAYGPFKFQAEYLNENFQGTSTGEVGFDRDIDVYYAGVSWLITSEHYADAYSGGAFGRVRPNANFRPGSGAWGALETGLRYSSFDAGDFKTTNLAGTGVLAASGTTSTSTNKADAWTFGLKWIINPNTRMYLNYVDTKFDTPVTVTPGAPGVATTVRHERALTYRVGFDF